METRSAGSQATRLRTRAPRPAADADPRKLLASLGWNAATAPARVEARTIRLREGALARISCSSATLRARADRHADPAARARMILLTYGYATLRHRRTAPMLLLPGQLVVVPDVPDLILAISEQARFFDYPAPLSRLDAGGRRSLQVGRVHPLDAAAVARFVAETEPAGEVLRPAPGRAAAPPPASAAAESALLSLLTEAAGPAAPELTAREAQLIARAREAVRSHPGRKGLSVQELADALGISRAYLHRLFVKAGTTPSAFLRKARRTGP